MIADLLDLTRTRLGGTMPLQRHRADIQELCEEVVLETGAARPEAVLRLSASGNLTGNWDADRLAQAVSNLVGNAIQHGEGTPVTITAHGEGDDVTLSVHNGGAPIPPTMLPSIFEPLARGGAEGAAHGIGLGLFISRAIVSAHAGEITVTSSREHGTTFTVRLPKFERSESAASASAG